ncbi:hypothetical protein K493DRAFT_265903 [Basidiobolus meristosporus CBS 931.73]|uniref:DUF8032 domain-containing protein n=1 Tax=Basidiobolus meristosporus CBS 931.73 TaxID=1314790 RepID=A0A1Y1XXA6_9FUNG|nr:hypothetical protein K493DRAFT_265903 [Basidiobolus meristosporus CBS 931.73]|eukprot:ORX90373.1 hypothetical protein K493DRAFT_265903 [Basidiobolus meristosporus CBS 931.73]
MESHTVHTTPAYPPPIPPISLASLIEPDSTTEQLLATLSGEQLLRIEKTVQRIKRKKANEVKRRESGGIKQHTNNPLNTSPVLDSLLPQNGSSLTTLGKIPASPSPGEQASPTGGAHNPCVLTNPAPNHALPATSPITEMRAGVEWVMFTYSVKGTNKEYQIRTDIDNLSLEEIDTQFKHDNCLYPRAFCTEDKYQGNRWAYETECNMLGWKLAYLNPDVICGKRGLLQRAVDSYRNRYPELRSRRVVRQEKLMNGTLRKRSSRGDSEELPDPKRNRGPKNLTLDVVTKGIPMKVRIRVDIEEVNLSQIDELFKKENCVYPRAFVKQEDYAGNRWEYESACNQLAWKLAWLNPVRLAGRKSLLQRAVDSYRSKFTDFKPRRGKIALFHKLIPEHPTANNTPNLADLLLHSGAEGLVSVGVDENDYKAAGLTTAELIGALTGET